MKWGTTDEGRAAIWRERRVKDIAGYYWFAWYPVYLDDGQMVWLQPVFAHFVEDNSDVNWMCGGFWKYEER